MRAIPNINKSKLLLRSSRASQALSIFHNGSQKTNQKFQEEAENEFRRHYSSFSNRNRILLKPDLNSNTNQRLFGLAAFRVVRSLLKMRYFLIGGALTGGGALLKTMEDWKKAIPDTDFIKDLLPSQESMNSFRTFISEAADKVKFSMPEFSNRFFYWKLSDFFKLNSQENLYIFSSGETDELSQLSKIKEYLNSRLEGAIQAAEEEKKSAVSLGENGEFTPRFSMSAMSQAQANTLEDKVKTEKMKQKYEDLIAYYQKKIESMEKEIKDLHRTLETSGNSAALKKIKKSLIEMYSEVLDELCDFDTAFGTHDHLPRVVVVGDQSSGKTSVLEMIAQARIFPRGGGEMMTRAPVMVTLMEGPYHIAQFKDSAREYDLSKESELADLRNEVEMRMRKSIRYGKTISPEVISMSVKGPGLQRMVLVDLPGIISTVTTDMASDTREAIKAMSEQYMANPNAIILCIQDGSLDAERSNVTDLVNHMDPTGKRTIFVLTKFDLAEETQLRPGRIKKILAGELFPMKALGYFAVVTGRGNTNDSIQTIKQYEENFFKNSVLLKQNVVNRSQCTTKNLSSAVSELFWKMIKDTVELQAVAFKATRYNLETEWKNTFPRTRELDRNELFEKAKGEILDEVVNLSQVSTKEWEDKILTELWNRMSPFIFDNIYIPACQNITHESFNTEADIRLKQWTEEELAEKCVEIGWEVLKEQFRQFMHSEREKNKSHDTLFDNLKDAVFEEAMNRHKWESKASEVLRVIQLNALEDRSVHDKLQWTDACKLLEDEVKIKLAALEHHIKNLFGPGYLEKWMYWQSATEDQNKSMLVNDEIQKIFNRHFDHKARLSFDELTTIKKNLHNVGVDTDDEFIKNLWNTMYKRHFYKRTLEKVNECRKVYYAYRQGIEKEIGINCSDIVLFWRLQQILKVTSNSLRQQIINREVERLENEIKQVLEEFSLDRNKKEELLTGRRVTLAEELKRVRQIQRKLGVFIEAINNE